MDHFERERFWQKILMTQVRLAWHWAVRMELARQAGELQLLEQARMHWKRVQAEKKLAYRCLQTLLDEGAAKDDLVS
ncbi:MAG: hypothetical protein AAGJ35_11725 [Myxococcota bacterium]